MNKRDENRPKISVLLPVFNSEMTIRRTLDSVRWADEILVVDSGSTDRTVEICHEYGARVLVHEYINSAKQKNWAIPQCAHEWILQIDSDEALEEGLREEIFRVVSMGAGHSAFRIKRKNFAYGRWLRYGGMYPDFQTRLFRRDLGRFQDKEVHAHVRVPGTVGELTGALLHWDFKDISTWLIKFERYMRYEADQLSREGRRYSFFRVTLIPAAVFMRNYFFYQGFRDGFPGLMTAVFTAFYCFVRYAKLWERAYFSTSDRGGAQ